MTQIESRTIFTGQSVRVNDIICINDTLILACGGNRDEEGWIFNSSDYGEKWISQLVDDEKSLYCLGIVDSSKVYCGGDFLHLWESNDLGLSWSFHWLGEEVPFHEQDRPAFRSIDFVNGEIGYLAGGENLGEGVVYATTDSGLNWDFQFYPHEFRDIDFSSTGEGYVAGHGIILKSISGLSGVYPLEMQGDFFTVIESVSEHGIVSAGYNGGIYLSENKGETFQEIVDSNAAFGRRLNWNDAIVKEGVIYVVGNNGMLAVSSDFGKSYTFFELESSPNLYCVDVLNEALIAGSDDGTIVKFSLP